MIVTTEGNISIITHERLSLEALLAAMNDQYETLQNNNIIVNLFSITPLAPEALNSFISLSNTHRENNHSFVLVYSEVDIDELSDELIVVPTLQEAKDIIEMEEIERDLGF